MGMKLNIDLRFLFLVLVEDSTSISSTKLTINTNAALERVDDYSNTKHANANAAPKAAGQPTKVVYLMVLNYIGYIYSTL